MLDHFRANNIQITYEKSICQWWTLLASILHGLQSACPDPSFGWNERSNWHCQALDFLAVFTRKHFLHVTEQWPLSQRTDVLLHKWSTQQGPVLPSGNAEQEGCHCHIHPALLWAAPQVREEAAGSCMSSSQATGIGKLRPTLQTRACSWAFLYMQGQLIIWHICRKLAPWLPRCWLQLWPFLPHTPSFWILRG